MLGESVYKTLLAHPRGLTLSEALATPSSMFARTAAERFAMRSAVLWAALTGAEFLQTGRVEAKNAILGVPNVLIAHGVAYEGMGRVARSVISAFQKRARVRRGIEMARMIARGARSRSFIRGDWKWMLALGSIEFAIIHGLGSLEEWGFQQWNARKNRDRTEDAFATFRESGLRDFVSPGFLSKKDEWRFKHRHFLKALGTDIAFESLALRAQCQMDLNHVEDGDLRASFAIRKKCKTRRDALEKKWEEEGDPARLNPLQESLAKGNLEEAFSRLIRNPHLFAQQAALFTQFSINEVLADFDESDPLAYEGENG